ncbi:MAG: SUMF1/EgtB/PvdO family nonheme iron enzyme [Cytophagales bacterium]|nr:SUMF1/EgtB/PvdO family nonheme iron enzyme [Cytophagales bacterium]MCA6369023.1 SUMF1/EgtB/PvdO family nonheme iron enzyme [Cytophagales bacterium]MCA6375811.1 SUMF1/EgtB/PvdO family nonheme iron enzyme [Cytophagales bacterium]
MKNIHFYYLITCLCGLVGSTKANNLVIGTPTVSGANLQFTIQWDNSWNTALGPTNYDGVWVFVKRQVCSGAQTWDHSLLSTISGNHSVTGGVLQVDAVTDGVGVFIRRSATGNGNIASSTVTLDLQTDANLIDNFQVFGIEMVFIPTGNFIIGDGVSNNGFNGITITAATQAAGFATAGAYQVSSLGSTGSPSLPSAYPQGHNAFYSMKYEVSQEQYVKFLNSLTFNQQTARTNISPASATGSWPIQTAAPNNARNGIRIMTPGTATTTPAIYGCDLNVNGTFNEAADGQNVACNWLSWPDLMTYLDWSGLRPMTEMEYEKACRGSGIPSVANEYAWGSTTILQATSGALTNGGQGAEVSTASGNGLCAYGSANATTFGPLRCGFAAGAATTRVQAGASYYGVMDMSGNVFEQCVGGRSFDYSSFNGLNGDGTITAAGLFNTANWPTAGGGNAGGITRGGSFNSGAPGELRLSDRSRMDNNTNQSKQAVVGGRGVRIP